MLIDGKSISNVVKKKLSLLAQKKEYRLDIVYIGRHKTIERYIRAKQKFGQDIGVSVHVHTFDDTTTEEVVLNYLNSISKTNTSGIIIQLPLPLHFNKQNILNAVPKVFDIDMLSEDSQESFKNGNLERLPPVVGACKEIIDFHSIDLRNKNIVLLGSGSLVGQPLATWLTYLGYPFTQLSKNTFSKQALERADIIFSGIGVPHFIKPEMVKEGAIILDAGTSEESEVLLGDIDPLCQKKASLFTPVPGGIGPLTVACLFKNMIQ